MMPPTAKRGVRPKDLYLLRTVVDPQVSPDGKRVAYVVTWPDRDADETRTSVYVAPLDGRVTVRRGKADNGRRLVRRPAGVVAQRQDDRVCLRPRDAATPETVAL